MAEKSSVLNRNFFKTEIAGIEMWTWMAIALAVLLIASAYRRNPPGGAPGGPPGQRPEQVGTNPYVFLLPETAVARPDAPGVTTTYPVGQRAPGTGPSRANPTAFGFEWSPYTVLGLKETRKSPADTSPFGIATVAYGLDKDDTANSSYFASLITANNPGIDWSRPLHAGTVVMIPKLNTAPPDAKPTQFNG
ncbi:hypothetical protein HUO13_26125 [Saccharopolyspora erythraea]|uniref:hypothetical protein n=1 Tax=Saccharopolyspora erythraea TaxID=1836 RepID=UPI001BAB40A7|nr:hypothetical protein [Saccharopolyspora erythraea]QUH03829.1 hypothetical protein HUO13_26125 [Saccharopolyspora erythraea]